jgi:Predicted phosphohydrolases
MKIQNIKGKIVLFILCISVSMLMTSCTKSNELKQQTATGDLKISVISDPHLYTVALGTTGSTFEKHSSESRKMVKESEQILDAAFNKIKNDSSDILLIPGDLTKDGEKVNHELMAKKLKELEAAGKKVYVINGNHDISNTNALQYSKEGQKATSTVSTEDFKKIYQDFGYSEAISQDKDSLSYVVEPVPGYRIIAIDACQYNNSTSNPASNTGGEIKSTTLKWIKKQVKAAKKEGKIVIGMMHQGIIPHFSEEVNTLPEFLVANYSDVASKLADLGISVVFTGHLHSQDISAFTSPSGNKIYDIETGSIVTYPVPIRTVTIHNNEMKVTTSNLDQVPGLDLKGYQNFADYAIDSYKTSLKKQKQMPKMLAAALQKQGMDKSEADKKAIDASKVLLSNNETAEAYLIDCMVKHNAGDETQDASSTKLNDTLLSSSDSTLQEIGKIGKSLSTDSGGDASEPVADNSLVIKNIK